MVFVRKPPGDYGLVRGTMMTGAAMMAMAAVHNPVQVLHEARNRIGKPRRNKKLKKYKQKRGLRK